MSLRDKLKTSIEKRGQQMNPRNSDPDFQDEDVYDDNGFDDNEFNDFDEDEGPTSAKSPEPEYDSDYEEPLADAVPPSEKANRTPSFQGGKAPLLPPTVLMNIPRIASNKAGSLPANITPPARDVPPRTPRRETPAIPERDPVSKSPQNQKPYAAEFRGRPVPPVPIDNISNNIPPQDEPLPPPPPPITEDDVYECPNTQTSPEKVPRMPPPQSPEVDDVYEDPTPERPPQAYEDEETEYLAPNDREPKLPPRKISTSSIPTPKPVPAIVQQVSPSIVAQQYNSRPSPTNHHNQSSPGASSRSSVSSLRSSTTSDIYLPPPVPPKRDEDMPPLLPPVHDRAPLQHNNQQHASPKVGRARLSTPTSPVIPTPQKTPFSKRVTPEKLPSIPDPPQEAYEVLPEPNNNVKPSEMVKQKKGTPSPSPRNKDAPATKPWKFIRPAEITPDVKPVRVPQTAPAVVAPPADEPGEIYSELPDDQPDQISGGSLASVSSMTSNSSDHQRPLPQIPETGGGRKPSLQEEILAHRLRPTNPQQSRGRKLTQGSSTESNDGDDDGNVKAAHRRPSNEGQSHGGIRGGQLPGFDVNSVALRNVKLKPAAKNIFSQNKPLEKPADTAQKSGVMAILKSLEKQGTTSGASLPQPLPEPLPRAQPSPVSQQPSWVKKENQREPVKPPPLIPWKREDSGNGSSSDLSGDAHVTVVPSVRKAIATPDQLTIDQYPWFFGHLDRITSIKKVKAMNEDGAFMVRNSTKDVLKPYTLAVAYENDVKNLQIRKRPDGTFAIGEVKADEQGFSSMYNMVTFHREKSIILKSGGCVKLTNSPSK